MLARLPFRLGLGRVWTSSFTSRPLRPICILVRTRTLFCFMYDLDLCIIFLDILTRGVFVVIIYSFVGSIVNLCNCCYSIPPASCACSNVHEALGGAFSKRHHVDYGLIAIICKVPILGRRTGHQYIGARRGRWGTDWKQARFYTHVYFRYTHCLTDLPSSSSDALSSGS
jgi:hypothetical protein